jgi:hypothetical protein
MKKHICERAACYKTATRKTPNGHYVCEDCLKHFRQLKREGGGRVWMIKERHAGSIGHFAFYVEFPVYVESPRRRNGTPRPDKALR